MLYLRWRWLQWEDEEIQTQQYFVMVTPFNLRRLSDQNACIFYLKNGRYGCKVCTWFWGNFIPLSLSACTSSASADQPQPLRRKDLGCFLPWCSGFQEDLKPVGSGRQHPEWKGLFDRAPLQASPCEGAFSYSRLYSGRG